MSSYFRDSQKPAVKLTMKTTEVVLPGQEMVWLLQSPVKQQLVIFTLFCTDHRLFIRSLWFVLNMLISKFKYDIVVFQGYLFISNIIQGY